MPQRSASANLPRLVDLKFQPPLAETQSTLAPILKSQVGYTEILESQVGYTEILESQVGYQGKDGYFKTLDHHETTQTSLNKSPALDTEVGKQLTKTISPDLKLALRPRPAESESTTSAQIEAATFNPPFENKKDDKNFEITPAPPPEITPAPTNKSPAPETQYDEQVIMLEIFKSPEFIYAVIATMLENIAHNDPNTFQNKQALKILEELTKESPNQNPLEDILKLSELAKDRKKLDRNFSLVADSIRLIAGTIALSSSIYESSKKVDDSEMESLNSAAEISLIISTAAQIIASPITAYEGYQASIVGHFAEELSDAFESVANKLASKLGESNQGCSNPDPNHKHAKTGQQEGHCDHVHVSHAGASSRHLGTVLNVTSMGISASSALYRLMNFINNKTVSNLYTSISAVIAPIFSITGKTSSAKAAEIRKDEINKKILKSEEAISKTFYKILCKKIYTNGKLKFLTPELAKDEIKLALVTIGKEAEEITMEKRSQSRIKMHAKTLLTYIKDSIYGAPYNVVTYFRHANGQTQNFQTKTDLEQQNRKNTEWDLDLSKIKEEIGLDKIENCNERLQALLKQNSSSSEPENTGTPSGTTKRMQEPSSEKQPSTKVNKRQIIKGFGVLMEDLDLSGGPLTRQ
jgi:hypothetical protein